MDGLFNDIDNYLDGLLKSDRLTLVQLFEKKVQDLKLTPTNAFKIMGVQSRTMNGILTGSQKLVDAQNVIKLANFLQLPRNEVFELYLEAVESQYPVSNVTNEEITFIRNNFDLAVLRKAGVINTITDYEHIKKRITSRLGLKSIFEFKKPAIDIAFSSGLYKSESNLTRAFWINAAQATLSEVNNSHPYDREALIKLFPKLRWYSTDVERGLLEVSRLLFEVGITVIYQAPMQTLQLRGATFNHHGKPCIILTNYRGFYATLWFALVHELFHVLFDWDEIRDHKYHLTDDSNEQLSVQKREKDADDFARTYLFSREKMDIIRPYLSNDDCVSQFATDNQIEKSIIYVFYAFDVQAVNRKAWARAKYFSPKIERCKLPLNMLWDDESLVETAVPKLAIETYADLL